MNIPMIKIPKFTTTLPYSGVKVEFRPFLVKEEKILLLANESDRTEDAVQALKDIIESCTFGKVQINDYCLADMQWLFLQIRGKSIGEEIDVYLICGKCEAKQLYTMNVSDFETVVTPSNNVISIDGSTTVELKYPTLEHYAALYESDSEETIYQIVANCITKIYNEDEMFVNEGESQQELLEFIDNLTPEQFSPFEQFFKNMPVLHKKVEFTCRKCETGNSLVVDGINHFFG
jgi:hypothetical protein